MPSLTVHRSVLHAAVFAALLAVPARAATLTWGTSGTGGTGTWTTTGGWWDGTSNVDWNSAIPDNAVFAGTAGTVTLNTDFTAGALTFNTSGYLLTGNTLTLGGAAPSITMGTNVTGTIASILAGSSGLTTSGAGSLLTLTAANTYTGTTTISSGTLRIGNGGTTGSLSATGTINGSSGAGLAFNRSNSITQGTDFGALIGGSINVSQIGSGTVTLNAANTYAGSTTISAGRLSLTGGNNRLPTTTSLAMSGGTLDVGSTSQTITNFTASNGTAVGSGTLSVSSASGGVQNVNLSSLARFSYDAGTNGIVFGGQVGGGSGNVTLSATSNYIRAGTVNVSVGNTFAGTTQGSLFFGADNTLYTSSFTIGYGTQNVALATFAAGLTNPSLTIRGQNGTARSDISIGGQTNNTFRTTSGTFDTEAGTLDALVGTMTIGRGHTVSTGQGLGYFYMGSGTIDATTITLASANVQNAQGTMRVSGGTVIVGTLNMGVKGSTGTPTATFTLQNSGVLEATSITAPSSGATSTFTWNAGTIRNKSGGNLTINSGITTFNVATSGSHVFDIGSGRSGSVAANMSGVGQITSVGSGTLRFSGSNSYAGGTRITAGRLILGSSNALGSSSGALAVDGGTLDLGTVSPTVGMLSGSAGGTITTTSVAAVTLSASSGTGTTTFAGAIQDGSGTVGLTKLGTGMLVLSGSNTYSGTTAISGGTILFDSVTSLYGGTSANWTADRLVTGAGDVAAFTVGAASPQFTATDLDTILGMASTASTGFLDGSAIGINVGSSESFSYGSAIANPNGGANALGLVKLGDGTLTLSASNSYSGGTQLAAGLLNFGDVGALGTGTVTFTGSATLQAGTAGTFANAIAVASGVTCTFDTQSNAATLSGPISGAGGFAKAGDGTLTLSASNSFSGGTTLADGTLQLGHASALGSTGVISFLGGTLQFSAANTADYSPRFSNAAGQAYAFDTNSNNVTLGTALTSSGGSLAKIGSGTLTVTADNSYDGSTTVSGGVLRIGNGGVTGALGSGPVTNNAAVTFERSNDLTVANVISGSGAVTKLGAGTLTLAGANTYAGSTTLSAGRLNLSGGDNRLPTTTALTISGGTLDVGSTSQSVRNVTASTGTIQGSGMLSVTAATGGVQNVTMTTLGGFSYDAGSGSVVFGGQAAGQGGTVILSGSNYIRAGTISLPVSQTTSSGANGTMRLGQTNTLHTNTIAVGYTTRGTGVVEFNTGLTNPGLTIRAQNGTGRAAVILGRMNNTTGHWSTGTLNTESGVLDALVSTLNVGWGHTTGSGYGDGLFSMGQGTLDATTIELGRGNVSGGRGVMRVASGTVTVTTLAVAIKPSTGPAEGSLTLNAGAVLQATTVSVGVGGWSTFTWNDGVIRNKTGGNLTIGSGFTTFALATSGTHTFEIESGRTGSVAQAMSGAGSLTKAGAGRLQLTGSNTYTGLTQVTNGTLVVNGSLVGNVQVDSGAVLAGSGNYGGQISGAGTISVGNSPGIATAGSVNPAAGTGWIFEVTGTAPIWNSGTTASTNDVLRLTEAAPFSASFAAGNVVDVLFNLASNGPVAEGAYQGGFFVDNATVDLAATLAPGTFRYWVAGQYGSGGDQQEFAVGTNGALVWYSALAAYDPGLSGEYRVIPQTVDFGAGAVTGLVTEFVIVPEPGTLLTAGVGIAITGWSLRKRRRLLHTDLRP